MACGGGLPGFGGTRNPGCDGHVAGPNDKASMWKVQLPAPQSANHIGIYAGADLTTAANWVNHVVLRDVEVAEAPGAAQSSVNYSSAARLLYVQDNPLGMIPCVHCQAVHVAGFERVYVHGNDPGDAGQPATGASLDTAGNCKAWDNSGTVTVAPDAGNTGTSLVTFTSGAYFGMTFQPGSAIYLNGAASTPFSGTAYTIANTSYTQGALNGTQNTEISINGSVTFGSATVYNQANPPAQYTPGCGDDVEKGISVNGDYVWLEDSYLEKIHWTGSQSQGVFFGYANGPLKIVNNYLEGASETLFSGGATVDNLGGPGSDNEIRRNYIGKDLNWRQLTGSAANSPAPPWGCGAADGTAGHNTCPFTWEVANDLELKMGHRNLIDGNVIDGSWADTQSGFCVLVNVRSESGGTAGVYDPATHLPSTYIDNIRFSNNWVRNWPVQNNDFINNLYSNVADANQWGAPGHELQWTSGQNQFTCTASYSGTGPYTVTQKCLPMLSSLANPNHLTKIAAGAGGQVTMTPSINRWDPMLCPVGAWSATQTYDWNNIVSYSGVEYISLQYGNSGNTPGSSASWWTATTCAQAGETLTIANHTGWNGTFEMTGTTLNGNPGGYAGYIDGTGGDSIVYTDAINNPSGGTCLCDEAASTNCTNSPPKCSTLAASDIYYASTAFKMTDISVGDDVYASDTCTGTENCPPTLTTNCAAGGYAVGATAATYAVAGTIPNELTVVYQVAHQPAAVSATCIVNNGAGFPKYTTFQNNTVLAVNAFDIENSAQWWLPISNYFFNNVFADKDSGQGSDVLCTAVSGGEGYASYPCWDANTFEFYGNALAGRSPGNWNSGMAVDPLGLCAGTGCANVFPALSGSYPASSCGGSSGAGQAAAAPFNCPMMAAPWANNFSLSGLAALSPSGLAGQGVNSGQLQKALTQTEYVCPAGANCGTHGPYPD
jgi:hypothetical protein